MQVVIMKKVLFVSIFVYLCHFGTALNCYTCTAREEDTDKSCFDYPENTTITNCNKKYCTIDRQEYLDPKDKIASIFRACEDNPLYLNDTIVEDETYRFYFTACQEPLCNGGSGKFESAARL